MIKMFEYKYKIENEINNTTYGSICIKNIVFNPIEIQQYLPNIVFDDQNVMYMFAESQLNNEKKKNIYKRFIPKDKIEKSMDEFIKESIKKNKNFYSFLAEGILGLVYRDVYGYKLSKGVIDITGTLNDVHTGVDACMYNVQEEIIVCLNEKVNAIDK